MCLDYQQQNQTKTDSNKYKFEYVATMNPKEQAD